MAESMNCTVYTFKESGKWYETGRGVVTENIFKNFNDRRKAFIELNGGKCPGLSSPGKDFVIVVIPDESCDFGFPQMWRS